MATNFRAMIASTVEPEDVLAEIASSLDGLRTDSCVSVSEGAPQDVVTFSVTPKTPVGPTPFEVTVDVRDPLARRITVQVAPWNGYTIMVIDEDDGSAAGERRRIPEPSSLTRQLVALAKSMPISDSPQRWPLGRPPIIGVVRSNGIANHIVQALEHRTGGMAEMVELQPHESPVTENPEAAASDGGIVWCDPVSRQHLVFPPMLVATQPDSIARRIQTATVAALARRPVPKSIIEAIAAIRTGEDDDPDWPALAEWFEKTADDERRARLEAEDALVSLTLDADEILGELDTALRRVRFLERAFRDQGMFAFGLPDAEELPEDVNHCVEVLEYTRALLDGVRLSPGIDDRAARLDEDSRAPLFAKRAWLALRAMNDYVLAKAREDFRGDFLRYCTEPPSGYSAIPKNMVALHESGPTLENPAMRAARVFGVPPEVVEDREVLMEAHVKVANGRGLAPRMHFYDDTGGLTGKVYVGYLGAHLPVSGG